MAHQPTMRRGSALRRKGDIIDCNVTIRMPSAMLAFKHHLMK